MRGATTRNAVEIEPQENDEAICYNGSKSIVVERIALATVRKNRGRPMREENESELTPALHPFEQWLLERHKWLQTAAVRLIRSRALPDTTAIQSLANLCLMEASKQESDQFEQVPPGALAQASVQPPIRLRRLSEVTGVNAIKDGATLDFGITGLTVVYGANGSGKSGYARLIKQICGSRAKEDLLGNVFKRERPEPSARIFLTVGEDEKEGVWNSAGGPIPQLRHIHVFDSSVAALYFGPKHEATYEPSRMRFVSSLIKICDDVSHELSARKNHLQSKLPKIPVELQNTHAARFLSTLRAGVSPETIATACLYTSEMDAERMSGETMLAQKDVPGRLKAIERESTALSNVKSMIDAWKISFGEEKLTALVSARADALKKRKAATEDAEKVFAGSPLDGVGQDSWRELWEKAREFSVVHAYKDAEYPNTGDSARCVLCQQLLDSDSKKRMQHFERFVKAALEKDASAAERLLKQLEKALPKLPDLTTWVASANSIKLEEAVASEWYKSLDRRRNAADTAFQADLLPAVEWAVVEAPCAAISTALESEKKALTELQQDGKRTQLTMRVQELVASQWLAREREAICEEVQRLNMVAAFTRAMSLASTTMLTKKNTELAEQELRSGYQDRFVQELKALNGDRLPVEPRSKQQGKGKVTFSLSLKDSGDDVKAESILSEGERRIIALAAFLADIAGSGQRTPFVFDDPISSLDQDFEEYVVERLVLLAQERQVIIFTHRLSLLALVESVVKKMRDQSALERKPAPVELHTTSLRRLGKNVGLVADISTREAKPEKALNRLRDETLKQLRKLHEAADVLSYEERAKGVCSDIRILVERCVEMVLLNEVLVRFRRSITTQGRIGALSKIRAADCAMIDDLMTRYSTFEHSQSNELPSACPEIDVLEKDVDALIQWVREFSARPIS